MDRICIVPAVEGIGGMASFRAKFEAGLSRRGIALTHAADQACDAILIIGGTRRLLSLSQARRRGVRIVQRLDGINWIHRKRNTGLQHYLRAEYGNLILSLIRSRIATHVLYQSEFAHRWWDEWYGDRGGSWSVVHNGVDLDVYQPKGTKSLPKEGCRLLVVEGSLGGGYDMGLENAISLAESLRGKHGLPTQVMVVGKIGERQRASAESRAHVPITFVGAIPPGQIPETDRSAHLLFSADLNPACPNSVIEALACGTPVVGFDTGALRELVPEACGKVVPYGGDPWKVETPDIPGLAAAAASVMEDREKYSRAARAHAESSLGLDKMMEGYLQVLLEA
jgi:glycosyltransferase involved in cell wall biosynthesis